MKLVSITIGCVLSIGGMSVQAATKDEWIDWYQRCIEQVGKGQMQLCEDACFKAMSGHWRSCYDFKFTALGRAKNARAEAQKTAIYKEFAECKKSRDSEHCMQGCINNIMDTARRTNASYNSQYCVTGCIRAGDNPNKCQTLEREADQQYRINEKKAKGQMTYEDYVGCRKKDGADECFSKCEQTLRYSLCLIYANSYGSGD